MIKCGFSDKQDEHTSVLAPRLVKFAQKVEKQRPMNAVSVSVEESPWLVVKSRWSPPSGFEKREQLSVRNCRAGHGSGRPSVNNQLGDRVFWNSVSHALLKPLYGFIFSAYSVLYFQSVLKCERLGHGYSSVFQ
jgi:hypothetical protein